MREILAIFGRLGFLGFGGPIAAMAMMEEETCRKRGWVTRERFAEIYSVCKILPGPVATQMAIYLGSIRGGIPGGLAAGFAFVLPSFFLVLAFSVAYVSSGQVARATPLFDGMQAGALVVIFLSTLQLAQPYRRVASAWLIALTAGVVTWFLPRMEPLVILAFGVSGAWVYSRTARRVAASILPALFWICFKSGAFVFGTGLAIVPLLEGEVVRSHAWLTHSQFMDGLAIGQVTPGPVVITATFIGYVAAGLMGALVATVGMFLPPFINVLFLVPRLWSRVSGTEAARGFTANAMPAVIGAILGTSVRLATITLGKPGTLLVFALGLAASLRLRIPAWILIPGAGAAGLAIQLMTR